jgi:hypothetical protein
MKLNYVEDNLMWEVFQENIIKNFHVWQKQSFPIDTYKLIKMSIDICLPEQSVSWFFNIKCCETLI